MSTNKICSEFVREVCDGRDPSHGYEHMLKVKKNAMHTYRLENINDDEIKQLCTIVAWCHDVADHKYDKDGKLADTVKEFLRINFYTNSTLIWNCIERISFSKEKHNKDDWKLLLGEKGMLVRNIVSDADKLEAVGKPGLTRCIEYASEQYMKDHGVSIPHSVLVSAVHEHSNDKLLRLKDYMRTKTGLNMAIPLHDELVRELANMI